MTAAPGVENEDALLRAARSGDTSAFAVLCERYRRRVWHVVASVTRGSGNGETEDLAQEAIVRAFRSLSAFRGESSFEAWLCRIALHAAHDYQKSAWRRRVLFWGQADDRSDSHTSAVAALAEKSGRAVGGAGLTVADPHDDAARREIQRRVRAAVAGLGPRERVPIWLIYFEEFRLAEVARLEGVPESTIRSRVKVGLKLLERVLGDLALSPDEAEDDVSTVSAPPPPPFFPDRPAQAAAAFGMASRIGKGNHS